MSICLGVEGMRKFYGSKSEKSDHPLFKYIDVNLEQIVIFCYLIRYLECFNPRLQSLFLSFCPYNLACSGG